MLETLCPTIAMALHILQDLNPYRTVLVLPRLSRRAIYHSQWCAESPDEIETRRQQDEQLRQLRKNVAERRFQQEKRRLEEELKEELEYASVRFTSMNVQVQCPSTGSCVRVPVCRR